MQVSFLHTHLNDYFFSPLPCCAREENLIMIFLISSINNGLNPTIFIVYLVNLTAAILKSLSFLFVSLSAISHHVFKSLQDSKEQTRRENERCSKGSLIYPCSSKDSYFHYSRATSCSGIFPTCNLEPCQR